MLFQSSREPRAIRTEQERLRQPYSLLWSPLSSLRTDEQLRISFAGSRLVSLGSDHHYMLSACGIESSLTSIKVIRPLSFATSL